MVGQATQYVETLDAIVAFVAHRPTPDGLGGWHRVSRRNQPQSEEPPRVFLFAENCAPEDRIATRTDQLEPCVGYIGPRSLSDQFELRVACRVAVWAPAHRPCSSAARHSLSCSGRRNSAVLAASRPASPMPGFPRGQRSEFETVLAGSDRTSTVRPGFVSTVDCLPGATVHVTT